jgi:hypothetical protein
MPFRGLAGGGLGFGQLVLLSVPGASCWRCLRWGVGVYGGMAVVAERGEGLAAPAAGFGGRPLAARRWVSCCRAFQAARMRWLRTMSRVVMHSIRGVRPMRRHQPRLMSLVAGPWRWRSRVRRRCGGRRSGACGVANTSSWQLTCDVLSQPNCHVASALAISETSGITEQNTAGLSWVHKRSIRGPRPLRARRGGSYGPLPSIERYRTQVSAQPLDHLPGYGDDVPVVV